MGNKREYPDLLKSSEVAELFRVDPKTIYRWTRDGKLPYALITPGGQYRYSATTIAIMTGAQEIQK